MNTKTYISGLVLGLAALFIGGIAIGLSQKAGERIDAIDKRLTELEKRYDAGWRYIDLDSGFRDSLDKLFNRVDHLELHAYMVESEFARQTQECIKKKKSAHRVILKED